MKPAIEVKGISKCYTINHKNKASYSTLKDDLSNLFKRPLGLANQVEGKEEKFWALQDISFEVPQGEVFGVIGKNGSGKSTLLKILSRIVEPTQGSITLRGRTASLLEVGTGFHPELTGRENIYFNGSMLGMSRQEIGKKFDEIVAFSEVEKFLDTPVKFYSSGMYVRLAFSVAAHLEPDILILDEVLAVGDAGFQKKSLRKITETMEQGRTVLFVSHSMGAIQQLCTKGILLNNGHIDFMGTTDELTSRYMDIVRAEAQPSEIKPSWKNDGSTKNDDFIPRAIYLTDDEGKKITVAAPNNIDRWVTIEGDILRPSPLLTIGIAVYNQTRTLVFMSYPSDTFAELKQTAGKGPVQLRVKIPQHFLNAGKYKVSLIGGIHNKFWLFEPGSNTPSIEFIIDDEDISQSAYWLSPREGLVAPVLEWEVKS